MIDGLYDVPQDTRNYALYDYPSRDLGYHPDEQKISDASKVLAVLFALAHAADWSQTLHIARNPTQYHEEDMASVMGRNPSVGKVNSVMALEGLIKGAGPFLLPNGYREVAQALTLGGKLKVINQNKNIGIGLNF